MEKLREMCVNARGLLNGMAKVQLGFFPTPFYRLNRLSEDLGVNLFIKRDDFTGLNLFGGNKDTEAAVSHGRCGGKGVRVCVYFWGDAVESCDADGSGLSEMRVEAGLVSGGDCGTG